MVQNKKLRFLACDWLLRDTRRAKERSCLRSSTAPTPLFHFGVRANVVYSQYHIGLVQSERGQPTKA